MSLSIPERAVSLGDEVALEKQGEGLILSDNVASLTSFA
jgi:hypothetical protein